MQFTCASLKGRGAGPSPKLQIEECVSLETFFFFFKKEEQKRRKQNKTKAKNTAGLLNIGFSGAPLIEAGNPTNVSQESAG